MKFKKIALTEVQITLVTREETEGLIKNQTLAMAEKTECEELEKRGPWNEY